MLCSVWFVRFSWRLGDGHLDDDDSLGIAVESLLDIHIFPICLWSPVLYLSFEYIFSDTIQCQ